MEFVRAHMIFKSVLALVDASDAKITTTFIMEYAKKMHLVEFLLHIKLVFCDRISVCPFVIQWKDANI